MFKKKPLIIHLLLMLSVASLPQTNRVNNKNLIDDLYNQATAPFVKGAITRPGGGIIPKDPTRPWKPNDNYEKEFIFDDEPFDILDMDRAEVSISNMAKKYDPNYRLMTSQELGRLTKRERLDMAVADASSFQKTFGNDNDFPTLQSKLSHLDSLWRAKRKVPRPAPSDVPDEPEENVVPPVVDITPKNIHILVHGIGGRAYHWSNNGTRLSSDKAYIRTGTLPYELAKKFGSNVYIGARKYVNSSDTYLTKLALISTFNAVESLVFYEPQSLYLADNDIIIYDDLKNSTASNNDFFTAFGDFSDDIYQQMNGGKFNLYGHSRGGLNNLVYATHNTDRVNKMFSLGTPYFPNDMAAASSIINSLPADDNLRVFVQETLSFGHYPAYEDLANTSLMQRYRRQWNNSNHENIDFTAYGYAMGLSFSIYIWILFIPIRIDFGVYVDWDCLVSAGHAQGLPVTSFGIQCGFINIPTITFALDTTYILEVTTRKKFLIDADYMLSNLFLFGAANYMRSDPGMPPVAHNLETVHRATISDIIGRI